MNSVITAVNYYLKSFNNLMLDQDIQKFISKITATLRKCDILHDNIDAINLEVGAQEGASF